MGAREGACVKVTERVDNSRRWLIIQLARFGDLMQSAPVLEAAAGMNTPPRIDLLVDHGLTGLAQKLDGVDQVLTSNRHEWLKDFNDPEKSLIDLRKTIGTLADDLNLNRYERVINLTHTTDSAYLASMIEADHQRGLVGKRSGFYAADSWERFFQAILPRRNLNPFNLVDIHMGTAGVPQPYKNGSILFNRPSDNQSHPLIALQLGANSPLRRPPIEIISAIIKLINKRIDARFILVGYKDERSLAEKLIGITPVSLTNLVGKTSLVELRSRLDECSVLVSGDTGTLHLAAVIGLPTVSMFFGMAQPRHTGPYGKGHYIVTPKRECYPCDEHCQCSHLSCHRDIPPEAIASLVLKILYEDDLAVPIGSTYRVQVTDFDDDGYFALRSPVVDSELVESNAMRQLWKSELNGIANTKPELSSTFLLNPDERNRLEQLYRWSNDSKSAVSSALNRTNNVKQAREYLVEFASTEARILQLVQGVDPAGMLAHMYRMEKDAPASGEYNDAMLIENALNALMRRCGYLLRCGNPTVRFVQTVVPVMHGVLS